MEMNPIVPPKARRPGTLSKSACLLTGVLLGMALSAIALVAGFIGTFGPSPWSQTRLSMSSPDCVLVLHARSKWFQPPTEYERVMVLFYAGIRFRVDLPDDPGGLVRVEVFSLDATTDSGEPISILFLDTTLGGVLVDLDTPRSTKFGIKSFNLKEDNDLKMLEDIASKAWDRPILINQWRYVASFNRWGGRWGINRNDRLACSAEDPAGSPGNSIQTDGTQRDR